jgi:hypothetical protein
LEKEKEANKKAEDEVVIDLWVFSII